MTTGLAEWRLVVITAIDGDTAVCRDEFGQVVEVPLDVQRAKGFAPAVGERWVIDRTFGRWTFAAGIEVTVTAGPGGSDAHYRHVQGVPESTWTVTHNLGKRPAVTVVTSSGQVVIGEVIYDSDDQVRLVFAAPFSGEAYFN